VLATILIKGLKALEHASDCNIAGNGVHDLNQILMDCYGRGAL
jgi:hypothetical protein